MSELLYLSGAEIKSVQMTYTEGVALIESGLIEKANDRVECPPKPGIHPRPHAFIHAMPAYLSELEIAGLKWVSGFPDNPARGKPYITGLVVINDPETGLPTAVMDASWITAFRTACVTGSVLMHLAVRPLRCAAVIGCGTQGRAHLEMMLQLFESLEDVRLFDVRPGAAEDAQTASGSATCRVVGSLRSAVEGAQAVVTAVAERDEGPAGTIQPEWVSEGMVMLPLANDYGWNQDALGLAERLFVDDIAQYLHFRAIGELGRSDSLPEPREFAGVLANGATARGSDAERICAMNIGLAIHDVVIGHRVWVEAEARGLGVRLPL